MADNSHHQEFIPFRFQVTLFESEQVSNLLCQGSFSEIFGLEANMTPKTYQEGGRNWGEVQLCGHTTFPPVILRRGITTVEDLWSWLEVTSRGANYGLRYNGVIDVFHPARELGDAPILRWHLSKALPTRFKGPDLSATASQVAIEELHLVHEGLRLERPATMQQTQTQGGSL